ncbi:MAG TPA: hypothetical protein VGD17_06855 [Chitinophagaceae bacterium]
MKEWLKKYRLIGFAALISIPAVGIYGYQQFNRKPPDMHGLRSSYVIASEDLVSQFDADEKEASAKYSGKVITVVGNVGMVQSTDSSQTVFLNDGISASAVICHFQKNATDKKLMLLEGEKIRIKGVCSGYLMDVVLVRCVVENEK